MKRITIIAILIAAVLSASAQGEWKWANYWTGNDDPLNSYNPYNYVVSTAFDDDGNVYVYGCFGGNARVYDQNTSDWLCDDVEIVQSNSPGLVVAKLDSLGNLVWSKTVKATYTNYCRPYDMVLHDNQLLISGEYSFFGGNPKLWFLDTLITRQTANSYSSGEHHPPYTLGSYSFFSLLDVDGNILENHFMKVLSRELHNGVPAEMPIADGMGISRPICRDSENNTYIAVNRYYGGADTMPFTLVIDEDTLRTYPMFLPGNCYGTNAIQSMMLYKFSPTWELIWMKLIIDHVEGVSPAIPTDTVNPYVLQYIGGLSVDENDNLYLSGFLTDMNLMHEYNQYPMRFYWDSTHYATADDYGLEYYLPFIIKYDSEGNVLWSNQAYVRNPNSMNNPNTISWTDNVVEGNSVYLVGLVEQFDGSNALYYFDNENNAMNVPHYTTCFVRFDKSTGQFQNFGVTPGEKTAFNVARNGKPAIANNHLMMLPRNYLVTDCYYLLCYFNIDGTFDKADTIHYVPGLQFSAEQNVIADHNGHILCDVTNSQDLTFGHNFTLSFDDNTRSHAVVAYRYDPSILVPYSDDSTGVAGYEELNTPIKLYPNPATNTLFLEHESSPIELIVVYDITGKELMREDTFDNKCAINISALPNGAYTVKTVCREGNYINKFVKTKN
jgi:hypothetical protein